MKMSWKLKYDLGKQRQQLQESKYKAIGLKWKNLLLMQWKKGIITVVTETDNLGFLEKGLFFNWLKEPPFLTWDPQLPAI